MPEFSYIQTFVPLEKKNFNPTIQQFGTVLQSMGLWNEEIERAINQFSWDVEDDGFVYSTTTEITPVCSDIANIQIKPLVFGISRTDNNSQFTNYLACELLLEAEDLRSLRMWRYYPSSFDLVRKLAGLLFNQFSQSVVYFTDEAQDCQDFDNLQAGNQTTLWKFDYALIPSGSKHHYIIPPITHQVFEKIGFYEAFFTDKWELKCIDSIITE